MQTLKYFRQFPIFWREEAIGLNSLLSQLSPAENRERVGKGWDRKGIGNG